MKITWKLIFILLLAGAVLAGCAQADAASGPRVGSISEEKFAKTTSGEEMFFTIPVDQKFLDSGQKISIRANGNIGQGRLHLVLRDPAGQTAWEPGAFGGEFQVNTYAQPKTVGDYQLGHFLGRRGQRILPAILSGAGSHRRGPHPRPGHDPGGSGLYRLQPAQRRLMALSADGRAGLVCRRGDQICLGHPHQHHRLQSPQCEYVAAGFPRQPGSLPLCGPANRGHRGLIHVAAAAFYPPRPHILEPMRWRLAWAWVHWKHFCLG